jgi:AraC-like DNA-binding protein
MSAFDPVFYGRQRRRGLTVLARHRHESSYAALVISGGYEEAGDRGRQRVRAGDVVIHGAFEAHLNRYDMDGAEVVNIPLPAWIEPTVPRVNVPDADVAIRLAGKSAPDAASYLLEHMRPATVDSLDWPDELASDLACNPKLRIAMWARLRGLADATVSRGFYMVYGVTPSAFRAHAKARFAWRQLITRRSSLTEIALEAGFSDQSHMTRAVRAITGRTPGAWRLHIK